MPIPIQHSTAPPTTLIADMIAAFFRNSATPSATAATSADSRIMWPNTIMGPALAPRREDSVIVTASNGPGIIAPDRPMIKAWTNSRLNSSRCPIAPSPAFPCRSLLPRRRARYKRQRIADLGLRISDCRVAKAQDTAWPTGGRASPRAVRMPGAQEGAKGNVRQTPRFQQFRGLFPPLRVVSCACNGTTT